MLCFKELQNDEIIQKTLNAKKCAVKVQDKTQNDDLGVGHEKVETVLSKYIKCFLVQEEADAIHLVLLRNIRNLTPIKI